MSRYSVYPKYKFSGLKWLAEIPTDWKVIRADFMTATNRIQIIPTNLVDLEVIHYSIPNVQTYGKGVLESVDSIESSKLLIKQSQLLVSKLNPRKATVCLATPETGYSVVASSEFVPILPDKVHVKYAFYVWSCDKVTDLLSSQVQSVTRSHQRVSPSDVVKIYWAWPSFEEQQIIASFLDYKIAQIDSLIDKRERLLERLAERRTALITQAVTKGLNPTVSMQDSGVEWLGNIPVGWDTCQVKRVAHVSYGVGGEIDRRLTEGTNLISLPNITKEGVLLLEEVPLCELDEAEKKEVLLQKGDLLFNWRNGSSEHLGKTAYFSQDGEWAHVSFLLKLRFDPSKSDSRYFQYMLNGLRITGFFMSSKAGVNNTFNLNELANLWIINPPKEEQKAIAQYLDEQTAKIDKQRARILQAIEKLKEYRAVLITNAVTGKIDVRGVELPETEEVEVAHV